MSALATRFSITGDVRCYAGEALTIELAFQAPAGGLIDLTGRQFAWTIYRARDREELFSAAGEVVVNGADRFVQLSVDGDTTEQLFGSGPTGYRHEIAEIVEAGRDIWTEGLFSLARSAATANPGVVSVNSGPVERLQFDFQTRRLVISPRGAPGVTAWSLQGQTYDAWLDQRVIAPVGGAVGDANDAAAEATAAATNANAKAALADAKATVANSAAAAATGSAATADTKAALADAKATLANAAATAATASAANADQKAALASTTAAAADAAAQGASAASVTAAAQAGYAQAQGDYAKAQGNAVGDVAKLATAVYPRPVAGGPYAITFGRRGGPVGAGMTPDLLWDFLGVRTLPIASPRGAVAATLGATDGRSGYLYRISDGASRKLLFGINRAGRLEALYGDIDAGKVWATDSLALKATGLGTIATFAGKSSRSGYLARWSDANGRMLLGIRTSGKLEADIDVPEVVAARGSATSLATRLARGTTPLGSTKGARAGLDRMRVLRSATSYLRQGGVVLVHIILDGDSWTEGRSYGFYPAIQMLDAELGLASAGPGWIGLSSSTQGGIPRGTARGTAGANPANGVDVTRDASWTDLFPSADAAQGTAQAFPGYAAGQATAAGAIITLTGAVLASSTSLTLYVGKGGAADYSWDGGTTWTAIAITAGVGPTTAAIGLAGKSGTLKLRASAGTVVAGLMALTAASGVIYSLLASSGSTAGQHAAMQANGDYQAAMATLPGEKAALIMLGLNDSKAAIDSATTVAGYVGTIRAAYRLIYGRCDVLVIAQPDTYLTTGFAMRDLSVLLRADAEDNDATFLDLQGAFGPTFASYDYGTTMPLLDNSRRHPSTGAAICGAGVLASTISGALIAAVKGL